MTQNSFFTNMMKTNNKYNLLEFSLNDENEYIHFLKGGMLFQRSRDSTSLSVLSCEKDCIFYRIEWIEKRKCIGEKLIPFMPTKENIKLFNIGCKNIATLLTQYIDIEEKDKQLFWDSMKTVSPFGDLSIDSQPKEKHKDYANELLQMRLWASTFQSPEESGDGDEMSEGFGEFGYEVSNPIPTLMTSGSFDYLDRLRDKNDKQIKYERVGSCKASNIKNIIDVYSISTDDKKSISLFICPYHKKTSTKAPKDFKLEA